MSRSDAGPDPLPGRADDDAGAGHPGEGRGGADRPPAAERAATPAKDHEAWAEAADDDERFTRERPPHW